MSFETGTASDMHDLLDRLRTFLIADGWSVDYWAADAQAYESWSGLTTAGSMRLHVHKTLGSGADTMTCYFNLRSATRLVLFGNHYPSSSQENSRYYAETRGIGVNGSTGYSGAYNWDAQPGAPLAGALSDNIGACITELPAGSFTYWLFANGDTIAVVAEIATDVYMHLAFGRLTNKGPYTGGMFYSASCASYQPSYNYWYRGGTYSQYKDYRVAFLSRDGHPTTGYVGGTTAVYLTADSVAGWRHSALEGNQSGGYAGRLYPGGVIVYPFTGFQYTNEKSMSTMIVEAGPNDVNALSPMLPVSFMCALDSGRFCYLGHPEGIRILNRSLYAPGQSMILGGTGGEEWIVFPAHQVGPDPDYPGSGDYYLDNRAGFAFRKS